MSPERSGNRPAAASGGRPARGAVWVAGLLVAAGAGVATAHGLYQVAIAARVPAGIAWLYPLITDGLALVAYAATARLNDARGRHYAWTVVVAAAGLSGIAQASWLAGGLHTSASSAPVALRFGVGAWPAIAAAVCAHLLHLLSTHRPAFEAYEPQNGSYDRPNGLYSESNGPYDKSAMAYDGLYGDVQPAFNADSEDQPDAVSPASQDSEPQTAGRSGLSGSAAERACDAARRYSTRHGRLPTASELMTLAGVGRGTAGTALKQLRGQRPTLQIVPTQPEESPQP